MKITAKEILGSLLSGTFVGVFTIVFWVIIGRLIVSNQDIEARAVHPLQLNPIGAIIVVGIYALSFVLVKIVGTAIKK